jgi:hypothetical protein
MAREISPATRFIMKCAPTLSASEVAKLAENEGMENVSRDRVYVVRAWMKRRAAARDADAAAAMPEPKRRRSRRVAPRPAARADNGNGNGHAAPLPRAVDSPRIRQRDELRRLILALGSMTVRAELDRFDAMSRDFLATGVPAARGQA